MWLYRLNTRRSNKKLNATLLKNKKEDTESQKEKWVVIERLREREILQDFETELARSKSRCSKRKV